MSKEQKRTRRWEVVSLLREDVLFTDELVNRDEIPNDLFLYEIGGTSYPEVIGNHIENHRMGFVLTKEKIPYIFGSVDLDIDGSVDWFRSNIPRYMSIEDFQNLQQRKMSIGEKIKQLRISNHLNLSDLSKLIGKSDNTVAAYETERYRVPIEVVERICYLFSIPIEEFTTLDPYKPQNRAMVSIAIHINSHADCLIEDLRERDNEPGIIVERRHNKFELPSCIAGKWQQLSSCRQHILWEKFGIIPDNSADMLYNKTVPIGLDIAGVYHTADQYIYSWQPTIVEQNRLSINERFLTYGDIAVVSNKYIRQITKCSKQSPILKRNIDILGI